MRADVLAVIAYFQTFAHCEWFGIYSVSRAHTCSRLIDVINHKEYETHGQTCCGAKYAMDTVDEQQWKCAKNFGLSIISVQEHLWAS